MVLAIVPVLALSCAGPPPAHPVRPWSEPGAPSHAVATSSPSRPTSTAPPDGRHLQTYAAAERRLLLGLPPEWAPVNTPHADGTSTLEAVDPSGDVQVELLLVPHETVSFSELDARMRRLLDAAPTVIKPYTWSDLTLPVGRAHVYRYTGGLAAGINKATRTMYAWLRGDDGYMLEFAVRPGREAAFEALLLAIVASLRWA